jgi:hypothetical protein
MLRDRFFVNVMTRTFEGGRKAGKYQVNFNHWVFQEE